MTNKDGLLGMEFRYRPGEKYPETIVRLHVDATLDQVAEAFELFLKGAGYSSDLEVFIDRRKVKP
jgi:hypothetical protein